MDRFSERVTSPEALRAILGEPSELVIKKQLDEIDEHMVRFIHEAAFVVVGTADQAGRCDVSPRGDWPAVAKVLDSKHLVIADRPGNRRTDTMLNILETGRVGLLFLIRGSGETLRINGRACITRNEDILSQLICDSKTPLLAIGVAVEECYFQCAKALIRSKLWDGASPATSRSFAQILIDQTGIDDETVESLEERIAESYRDRLY